MTPPPSPLVLAHRGLHRAAPENTLEALDAARRLGCDGVEFDVRRLRDGTYVLHHDAFLRRRGRRIPLASKSLEELRGLGVQGRRVPTLEAVIAWGNEHPGLLFDVELKDGPLAPALLGLLDRRRAGPAVVTSFDLSLARAVKQARPRWRVGGISSDRDPTFAREAAEAGLDLLVVHRARATRRLVESARRAGLGVWAWGVRFLPAARRLREFGVEALIVDNPRPFLRLSHAAVPRPPSTRPA